MASLMQGIKDRKTLFQMGFSMAEANTFVTDMNNEKNDSLSLYLGNVKDTKESADFFLDKIASAKNITKLSLERSMLKRSEKFLPYFFENINRTSVSSLELDDVPSFLYETMSYEKIKELKVKESFKPFAALPSINIKRTSLEAFSFEGNVLFQEDILSLKNDMPKTLKHLSVKCEKGKFEEQSLAEFMSKLSPELETLSLDGLRITPSVAQALAERLPALPRLKKLTLANGRLNDEALSLLAEPLAKSNVEELDIRTKNVSNETANEFLDVVEPPPCMISKISIVVPEIKKPKEKKTSYGMGYLNIPPPPKKGAKKPDPEHILNEATLKRIEHIEKTRQGLKAVPEKGKTVVKKSTDPKSAEVLFEAAKQGKISEIYEKLAEKGEKLSVSDYLQTNADNYKLIDTLAYSQQLSKVFVPENWINAKDMQTVFDAVADNQKYQVDGKDGRPNFIQNKGKVMQNAVKLRIARGKVDR